ncbi:MAG: glycosyltransferase [Bacteroidaceae bacterium]|nr:glycosyltransferase [Bacteroidaceae bacterium]
MKTVAILGHFSFHREVLNGQTVKTKIVAQELVRQLSEEQVAKEDTSGRWRFLVRMPFVIPRMLHSSRNVIIMPAFKAIALITPLLIFFNLFFRRRLHYVTVGGRLPLMLRRFPFLKLLMRHFDSIYVETHLVARELKKLGLTNVTVMPNCKPLKIISPELTENTNGSTLRLCTFSRVIPEKGIGDAIAAVCRCNEQGDGQRFELDIYGQVEDEHWFNKLMQQQPDYIHYKGCVGFEDTSQLLSHYFLMLFPTFYPGECFAGTLIDALAAALPVVASDWRSNAELVEEGRTGFLFQVHDIDAMTDIILRLAREPQLVAEMRQACAQKAEKFTPESVLSVLIDKIR